MKFTLTLFAASNFAIKSLLTAKESCVITVRVGGDSVPSPPGKGWQAVIITPSIKIEIKTFLIIINLRFKVFIHAGMDKHQRARFKHNLYG